MTEEIRFDKFWVVPQPLFSVKRSRKKCCEIKVLNIASVFVLFLYIIKIFTKMKILLDFVVGDENVFGSAVALRFVAIRLSVQDKEVEKTTMFEILILTTIKIPTTV